MHRHLPRLLLQLSAILFLIQSTCSMAENTDNRQTEKPHRIVSINLCADQLLMMLAERNVIVSLSELATDPALSFVAADVQRSSIPLNQGRAEQIVALNPDLIIASRYSATEATSMLLRLGYRVEILELTESIAGIEKNIRHIADLLDAEERGEQLIDTMNKRLARATQKATHRKRQLAVIYAPNGFTSGRLTLSNVALDMAGMDNLAAREGIEHYGNLSLETLLYANADVVIINDGTINQHSLAQRQLKHPALQRWLQGRKIIKIPPQFWICAGPMVADAVDFLVSH